jgi:hypothetical protein
MKSYIKQTLFLAWLFSIVFLPVLRITAQEITSPLDDKRAVLIYNHYGIGEADPNLKPEIEYTVYAMDNTFWKQGIRAEVPYINDKNGSFTPEDYQKRCEDADVRWALTVYTTFSNGRLTWRFSLYDADEKIVRATDVFFVSLYVGLSTSEAVDLAVKRLYTNYEKSFPASDFNGNFAVNIPQAFIAPEDGLEIRYGDPKEGIIAGLIEGGSLTTPLFLFIRNQPVYGSITKDGYWPKTFVLPKGITEETKEVPRLMKRTWQSLSFMTECRDLNDAAMYSVDFDYRLYFVPDRWFLRAGYAVWQDRTVLSSKEKTLHQELRGGTGLYLFSKNDLPFRVLAGTGVSLVFAEGKSNFLADPLWLDVEYHFPRWAILGEVRFPKIFEYSRDTFGADNVNFGLSLSFGVMLKW